MYAVKQMVERPVFSNKAHFDSQTPPVKLHLLTSQFLLPLIMADAERTERNDERRRYEEKKTSSLKIHVVCHRKDVVIIFLSKGKTVDF